MTNALGAITVSKVFKRACLLGAGEWFLLILVSFIFGPQVWFQSIVMGGDGDKPMIIGPGIMALVCLAVFALTRFRFRETAPAPVMLVKRCDHCGQLIVSLSVSGRGAGRNPQKSRGSSQDLVTERTLYLYQIPRRTLKSFSM